MAAASVRVGSVPGATQPGDHIFCGFYCELSSIRGASLGGATVN